LSERADEVRLNLLPASWNSPYPQVNGYTFACWLPAANDSAIGASDAPRTKNPEAAGKQSQAFVVYAWATDGEGDRVFALTQSGKIYSKPTSEVTITTTGPAWNAIFAGQGWDSAPTWTPYNK
jgi:hypothetical protein